MDSISRRLVRRNRAAQRGVSLIEGMTASVVLLIGLVGIFQGLLVASRQNIMANQATRASGIASQVRVSLDTLGWARVIGTAARPGLLSGEGCDANEEVRALAGGLESLEPTEDDAWRVSCIFDLDAYEKAAQPADRLLSSYAADDMTHYRRVLVVIDKEDEATGVTINQVTVVVSWMELGKRRFVRQYFGFYDSGPFGNETYVEI
ncbi:type IV pilus modification PilV family protein [Archangium lansingense]|uniref:Prepilin cleavage protein n=1 Tax=Archangium lansingense TaxID=2995310 RepID=A0ABT4AFX4_9BACT|nr:prepilin cleavage protein [Archangium lansinium]MCY1080582.1 prepilin cleavage protein [Archangium lansinium]